MSPEQPEQDPGTDEADLTLRQGDEEDALVLAELHVRARRAAVPQMPPMVHTPGETLGWFTELLEQRDREAWLAERDHGVVGYLVLDEDWLDSLYVDPGLTGNGIGGVLLDLAKGLRPGGLQLWVFQSNVRAQRFYRRHGFSEVERTAGADNEERAPDIRMTWTP